MGLEHLVVPGSKEGFKGEKNPTAIWAYQSIPEAIRKSSQLPRLEQLHRQNKGILDYNSMYKIKISASIVV